MLLDEDPATLIHHTIGNFNIAPDKDAIDRIRESLSTINESRALRIRDAESAMKKLSRTHNALAAQHSDTSASHAPSLHTNRIADLDSQKFRVAKAASALEIEGERLAAELESLRGRLQELEVQGVEGDEASRARREGEDPTVLKLKVYRSLGIDVEPDEAGNYNKAVVRNNAKGDVHVVNIDPRFSRFFYANYFWGTI